MKILISSTGEASDSLMDPRFGRCEVFQIFDDSTNEFTILKNKGFSSNGGAGIASATQIIDEDVNVVITGNVGPNAFKLLEKSNIKMYKGEAKSVKDLVESYKKGELGEITIAGPGHHGMNI